MASCRSCSCSKAACSSRRACPASIASSRAVAGGVLQPPAGPAVLLAAPSWRGRAFPPASWHGPAGRRARLWRFPAAGLGLICPRVAVELGLVGGQRVQPAGQASSSVAAEASDSRVRPSRAAAASSRGRRPAGLPVLLRVHCLRLRGRLGQLRRQRSEAVRRRRLWSPAVRGCRSRRPVRRAGRARLMLAAGMPAGRPGPRASAGRPLGLRGVAGRHGGGSGGVIQQVSPG